MVARVLDIACLHDFAIGVGGLDECTKTALFWLWKRVACIAVVLPLKLQKFVTGRPYIISVHGRILVYRRFAKTLVS